MLRVATIAVVTLGMIVAMVSVASGFRPRAPEPKPDKQPLAVYVVAPMDGIFWRGIYPGAAPYVEVGSTVEANTVVAHIEHMRTTKLTADGQLVKTWQPLIKIVPKPKNAK